MTAIIWKEVRENLKWAVLLMLGVAAATAYVFWPTKSGNSEDIALSLCAFNFRMVILFGSAAGGVLLGLLQIIPEMRRDQWAFLVHRPTTRTRLFFGKVLGGLLLFLSAMGIPLLCAAWWVATPGHVPAPFDWRMVLPSVANIFTGIVFYFAGMLTALRPARWYGSRALGIVAAVLFAIIAGEANEFWQAILSIIVGGTVLGLAAWGSFLTAGAYSAQPRVAKAALGITLLISILVTGVLTTVAIDGLVGERDCFPLHSTQYAIDDEGNIVLRDWFAVTDLNGNKIEKFNDIDDTRAHLLPFSLARTPNQNSLPSYQNDDRYFSSRRSRGVGLDEEAWYYVYNKRCFRGYSWRDNHRIGSIGPSGFVPAGSSEGPAFDISFGRPEWSLFETLVFPRVAYFINIDTRRITQFFAAKPGEEILRVAEFETLRAKLQQTTSTSSVASNAPSNNDCTQPSTLIERAVVLRNNIVILEPDGKQRNTIPYHSDIGPNDFVSETMLTTPNGVRYFIHYCTPFGQQEDEHIIEVASDGTEQKQYNLPRTSYLLIKCEKNSSQIPMAASVPLTGAGFLFDRPAISIASALVWGLVCLWIARRYAVGKKATIGWTISALFLGSAAILMLISLRDWPARESCHACGKKRVVDRDLCEHCGSPFPPPASDGTQIFEACTAE